MVKQYTTIQEMLADNYGSNHIAKIDAPILSTTTGVFNAVYGAMAFSQLNNEANAFALLPKYPWQHSGYRVITADAGSSADGGVAQGGAIPDTIKPTFAEITVPPKEVSHSFQVSYRMDLLAQKGDDIFGSFEQARPIMATKHAKAINQQLLVDGNTLAGNNFESIDRVTASAAYATAVSWDAADEDIYGIDRSASSWADAVVSHNSGTDRTFQLSYIEDTLATLENNGAKTNLILTGTDTYWKILGQAQNSVRYYGVVKQNEMVRLGINGVETEEGMNYGVRVATVYNIPLFKSQAVPKDTISRIYLLDTTIEEGTQIPRLGIAMLQPTMYAEAGMNAANKNPFTVGTFSTKGLFYTAGELVCVFFKAQGSIRDLK